MHVWAHLLAYKSFLQNFLWVFPRPIPATTSRRMQPLLLLNVRKSKGIFLG